MITCPGCGRRVNKRLDRIPTADGSERYACPVEACRYEWVERY